MGKSSSRDTTWKIILVVWELQVSRDQHPVTLPASPSDYILFLFKSCPSLILWVLGTGPF